MTEIDKIIQQSYSEEQRDFETFCFLGGDIEIEGFVIKQPTAGIMPFFEQHKSPLLTGEKPTAGDCALAISLLCDRELILSNSVNLRNITSKQYETITPVLSNLFDITMSGFDLIPSQGKAKKNSTYQRTFDSEWLAMIVSTTCRVANVDSFTALWRVPLISTGFYMATYAKEQGVEGVQRQIDHAAILKHIKEKRQNNGT